MATSDNMYIANLAFLLDYQDGKTPDEMDYEILRMAFQDKESVHYDRSLGGNFMELEQEPNNISTALMFSSNMIESIYHINREKNNDPYIVIGYEDIKINDKTHRGGEYLVEVTYRLLEDLTFEGVVTI
jgi:hypothetical protein